MSEKAKKPAKMGHNTAPKSKDRLCTSCDSVARVVKYDGPFSDVKGMFWVCENGHRERSSHGR